MRRLFQTRPNLLASLLILLVLGGLWSRTRVQPLGTYDQSFYLGIADDLVRHGRFTDGFRFAETPPGVARPSGMRFTPLYPALLAVSALLSPTLDRDMDCLVAQHGHDRSCGRGAGPVRTLQFLMLASVFWMIRSLGAACTGRRSTGWIALGLSLLTAPLLLLSVDYLMTETVSLFLFMLATTLAMQALDRRRAAARWLLGSGLALGLAILARPGFAWLGDACLATAAGLALQVRSRAGMRAALAFAAGVALTVTPWISRNWLVLGHAALTYGYGSHTFVQRLSFDGMGWHEYGRSFVCWLPDGAGIGDRLFGAHGCDRFGWDEHRNSFYAIGIGPMLVDTLRQAGGWPHHMSLLLHRYLLADPLRQLGWHAMVTVPLALRGLYVDHYWGLVLAPVCTVATWRALRRRDRRVLLVSLPAWFMLGFNAAVAVNQTRYNLMLVLPFSVAGALAIERIAARRRLPGGEATGAAATRRQGNAD